MYTGGQEGEGKAEDHTLLILLVRDLAHLAQTLASAGETVLQLEDFDLGVSVSV
jgi:hypothetical protein